MEVIITHRVKIARSERQGTRVGKRSFKFCRLSFRLIEVYCQRRTQMCPMAIIHPCIQISEEISNQQDMWHNDIEV